MNSPYSRFQTRKWGEWCRSAGSLTVFIQHPADVRPAPVLGLGLAMCQTECPAASTADLDGLREQGLPGGQVELQELRGVRRGKSSKESLMVLPSATFSLHSP